MAAFADNVLNEVLKEPGIKEKLSDNLLEYIYLLLVREQKNGFESFCHKPVAVTGEHVTAFAYALVRIFERFLNAKNMHRGISLSENGLAVPLCRLCGWSADEMVLNEHLPYELREPIQTEQEIRKFGYQAPRKFAFRGYSPFWSDLMAYSLGIKFSEDLRRKHTQIIGGTGAGKTTLLQQLIAGDIESGASVIVMDSSQDFIRTLKRSALIPPERLRIIDPRDSVEHPLSLNIFDVPHGELLKLSKVKYQEHMSNLIGMITFLFKSIMGEDLSGHMDGFLRYCCTLMVRIPGATIHTLIDLLENGTAEYQEYIDEMSDVAQSFFKVGFPGQGPGKPKDELGVTRRAIHRRLLWLLDNDLFRSFFTASENKFDMSEVMDNGDVLLISTDANLLDAAGSNFIGRYFIALLDQASLKRTLKPKSERNPVYVYIDEAGDYFEQESKMLTSLLYKGRKSNVGLTLTHHDTHQIDQAVYRAIRGSASVRMVGSPDPGEVFTLKRELRIDSIPEEPGRFAVYVRGGGRGFIARSKMGVVESAGKRPESEMRNIIRENRVRYCVDDESIQKPKKIRKNTQKYDEPNDTPHDPLAPLG